MSVARFACNSSRTTLEFGKANEQPVPPPPPPRPISDLCAATVPNSFARKGTHRARRFAFGSRFPRSQDAKRGCDAEAKREETRSRKRNVNR